MSGDTESSNSASAVMVEFSGGAEVDKCVAEVSNEDQGPTIMENSGIETIPVLSHEEISDMLLKAASLPGTRKRYPIFRQCNSQIFTSISKALVIYSSITEPTEAAHLFDPRFLVAQAYRTRNERKSWLFLLNLINSKNLCLDERHRLDLATKMTTVMKTGLKQDDKGLYCCKVAWIVGFWLSRLYEEYQGVQTSKLPKVLRTTRNYFLKHFGSHFKDMRIVLPEFDPNEESDPPQPEPEIIEMASLAPVPDGQHSNSNGGQDVDALAEILRSTGLELVAVFPSKEDQLNFGLDTLQICGDDSGPPSKRPRLELGTKEAIDQKEVLSMPNGAIGKHLLKLNRTQAVTELSRKITGFGISLMEAERNRIHQTQGRGESMLIGGDVRSETMEFLRQVRNWARDFYGDMQKVLEIADGKDVGGATTCIQI